MVVPYASASDKEGCILHIIVTIPFTSLNGHKIYRNLPGAEVGVNSVGTILVTLTPIGGMVPVCAISVQLVVLTGGTQRSIGFFGLTSSAA